LVNYNNKLYLLLFLVFATGIAHVAERVKFYYFNPDSTQSNLRQLKSHMDTALQKNDIQASFQPFARFTDLDDQIRKDRPALLYVPHWYFEQFGKELGLRPLLRSWRDNKSVYQKRLITNIQTKKSFNKQINTTLAMTTMGPGSHAVLDRLRFFDSDNKIGNFNIIEVPKDADAVFAVALGQVDSALVSSSSLQLLEKRNPRLISSVQVIAETLPINLPILCYVEGTITEKKLETLRQQLLNDALKKDKNIPSILDIDTWGSGS